MFFHYNRRLLAGILISTALLAGCAPAPAASSSAGAQTPADTSQLPPQGSEEADRSAGGDSSQAAPASQEAEESARTDRTAASEPDQAPPPEDPNPAQPAEGETPSAPQESGQAVVGSAELSSYDFSQPCPESPAVDNSYFEDAAFVGDSRTDGFLIYSGIGCGENLTSNGLSIFKLAEKKVLTIDGKKYTLLEALALKEYGKVYLSLGVNELGYNNDKGFYEAYCQAIDAIRACQPNAVIYIQGLIPLNEDVIAATGGSSYLTNEHLRVYNDLMKQAAQEKQVVFLDLYPEFVGEDGQLPAEASQDGVHLRKSYCQKWLEYLKNHTVSYETLYPTQEAEV